MSETSNVVVGFLQEFFAVRLFDHVIVESGRFDYGRELPEGIPVVCATCTGRGLMALLAKAARLLLWAVVKQSRRHVRVC